MACALAGQRNPPTLAHFHTIRLLAALVWTALLTMATVIQDNLFQAAVRWKLYSGCCMIGV